MPLVQALGQVQVLVPLVLEELDKGAAARGGRLGQERGQALHPLCVGT